MNGLRQSQGKRLEITQKLKSYNTLRSVVRLSFVQYTLFFCVNLVVFLLHDSLRQKLNQTAQRFFTVRSVYAE
jgi:hypothetical protein